MKVALLLLFMFLTSLSFAQNSGTSIVPKKIETKLPAGFHELFANYFSSFINKPIDPISFRLKVDQVNKELFAMGYYDSLLTANLDQSTIKLNYQIKQLTTFSFRGSTYFSHSEIKQKIVDKIKADVGKVDPESYKALIVEMYESVGVYGTIVEYLTLDGKDRFKNPYRNFVYTIVEGDKIPISSITYRGNANTAEKYLNTLYNVNATSLASQNYYDRAYTENFTNIIKKDYLSRGFVLVEVSKPRITSSEDEPIDIEYSINEKSQYRVNKIKLTNLSEVSANEIRERLINKEGQPINIPAIESDLKTIVLSLQSNGYYFANIINLNSNSLIKYDNQANLVDLNIDLNLESKVCFNDIVINGNFKTKSEVLTRESLLKKGEIITPEKLEGYRQKLTALGLFSSVRITPYIMYEDNYSSDCSKANLIVQVKERDFGLVEFTPGYRTDLGAKAGVGLTINNLQGMNRSFSIKLQGNQRFNLDSLDERRRNENKKLFEYSGKVSVVEPYFLYSQTGVQLESEASLSWQRKRFSSFDADILRISPQLSKTFNKNLSSSLKYQLEKINQFDATEDKDNDNFRIGSFTPSVTLDLRDDPINPKKGAYFNLTPEWANHYFGSMKNSNFEVNYIKVTLRNKFYFSLGNFVFATSLSTGYEKNYADGFYIPSIKVFRLDGFDEIRGFEDTEINRLNNGDEVSKVTVSDHAYFVAFKFEPRYNLTDNLQLNVFFDAGRVFVDKFQPLDLRTSIGLGFKILTPVGSLDFDYGVKLKRETYSDGVRDSFGRFHLSIGFF